MMATKAGTNGPAMAAARSTVAVVATGGTIANTAGGRVGVEEVLTGIRRTDPASDPSAWVDIEVREVMRIGAGRIRPQDWITIADATQEAVDSDKIAGVVVTHGTFTAEETAFFLHLTVHSAKPIALVCAQRKHGTLGNDGDRNLLDALRVACSPNARGQGCMLVANEQIHSAREVTKTSQRPDGFKSPGVGPLGSIESDQVSFYRSPFRRHTLTAEFSVPRELRRVDIIPAYPGADGVLVQAAVDAGAGGLVVSGFAYNGRPHPDQLEALHAAVAAGTPVVLASRGGRGRVPNEENEDLIGFVGADNLSAQKARVLLMVALAHGIGTAELQRVFETY